MDNVSVIELKGWAKYYEHQVKEAKKAKHKGSR